MIERVIAITMIVVALVAIIARPTRAQQPFLMSVVTTHSKASIRGIATLGGTLVYIGGSGGTLLRSADGGRTWSDVAPAPKDSLDFRDIEVIDSVTVVAMTAGPDGKSRIYVSDNGGAWWSLASQGETESTFYNGMAFQTPKIGWVVGDPIDGHLFLLQTIDGGLTWIRDESAWRPTFIDGEMGYASSGTGVCVDSFGGLLVVTGGSVARVMYTADSGDSWFTVSAPLQRGKVLQGIFSITFGEPNVGVVVGGDYNRPENADSTIAFTLDGGDTWKLADTAPGVGYQSCVVHIDGPVFLSTGTTSTVYTRDRGATWEVIRFSNNATGFQTATYDPMSRTGFLAGKDGQMMRFTYYP